MKTGLFWIAFSVSLLLIFSIDSKGNKQHLKNEKTEGCMPPVSSAFLDIGNVRARIHAGGDMWWDLYSEGEYEVPKGSRRHSMFSASIWIGGVDDFGQLRIAALRYRSSGNDFWPGPLTIDGSAAIDRQTCHEYDKLFTIYRKDVTDFVAWFNNPSMYPNYSVPAYFFKYPAHGDVTKGQARYLAPFFDKDGDGVYNVYKGDYPYYDIDNILCPLYYPPGYPVQPSMGSDFYYGPPTEKGGVMNDQVLKGDQTIWWVFNDKGNLHTETGGEPLGLEIRAQAYAFEKPQELTYSTFYSYEIINRSNARLNEVYVGFYTDCDIGYAMDDFIGSDIQRGLGYAYNGKEIDGTGAFNHYGTNPPAIGVDFIRGPYMSPDGLDNPQFGLVFDPVSGDSVLSQLCNESINGYNFGNGTIDDERMGMQRFLFFSGTGGYWGTSAPQTPADYYGFLKGIWKDGQPMMYGGSAHTNAGAYGPECKYIFPGNSDPCNWGTYGLVPNGPVLWTEETARNQPYDRRMLS